MVFQKGREKSGGRKTPERLGVGSGTYPDIFVLQPIFLFLAEERRSPTLFGSQICLRGPDRLTRVIAQGLCFA